MTGPPDEPRKDSNLNCVCLQAGTLIKYGMLQAMDKAGMSLADVLKQDGGIADPLSEVAAAAVPPEQIFEYIEVHMEQVMVLAHYCV